MSIKQWILGLILSSSLIVGCSLNYKRGDGDIQSIEYDLDEFEKVYIGGNYELTLIPSRSNKAIVTTDANLMPYINIEVHNETLNINNVHQLKGSDGIFIEVFYTDIHTVLSTGASKIEHDGVLETEELSIDLSGTGSIILDVSTDEVDVQMSGAGLVKLSGKTSRQRSNISGAGGLMAEELISETCDINLSGVGGAKVFVTEKLEASISGIGGITYAGNPKLIEKQVTGLGKIQRSDSQPYNDSSNEGPI